MIFTKTHNRIRWLSSVSIRLLVIIALIFATIAIVRAGSTGKISGKVIDAKSKEPLLGVNVVIPGTSLGASTNIEGQYTILNVSPNTYTLKASLLGYGPVTINGLQVSIDLTTTQNFELTESVVEQQEVIITAERPLVQKDMTASTAIVGKDLISKIAVTEVQDIVKLQAGVAVSSDGSIHLRGGRTGQIAYQIDGVAITDPYDNSNTIDVGANVIQELQVISGAFNAEYGQAMSGVVNIVTRDGGSKLSGNFQTYAGSYVTKRSDIYWNLGSIEPTSIRSFEGTLSGPIIEDKLAFFANGRYSYNTGYLFGKRTFLTTDISREDPNAPGSNFIITPHGNGAYVSMNPNERIFGQGKISYRVIPSMKLSYNYIYDHQNYQDFDQNERLTPDNNLQRFRKAYSNILSLNHAVSSSSFYTASFSYLFKDYRSYLFEDIYTGVPARPTLYVDNNLKQNPPFSFDIGGTNMNRFARNTGTYSFKLDWTSQLDKEIQLQLGGEYKKHLIYYENINLVPMVDQNGQQVFPYNVTIPSLTTQDHDEYSHRPYEAAGYIQSKFEAFHLIFNAGVRFDAFNPNGVVLSDPTDPDILSPIKPSNQFNDLNGDGVYEPGLGETQKTVADRAQYWYKNASTKYQVSPRLGLAFPISADGVIHFSYGHFFQLPGYEFLYTNPGFKLGVGSGNQGLMGNADLQPQKTVKGEIGLKQQLSEDIAVDVTMFFEDFRNLTGTQTDEIVVFSGERKYSQYANSDFGSSKGIVLKIEKRFFGGLATSLDYTYSITKGNASNPTDARNALLGGGSPETFIAPLDWDQRHTLNLVVAYSKPKDWGFSLIGNYFSGQPFTPAINKNSSVKKNAFPTNSAYKPNIFNVDIRMNKDFAFDNVGLSLFVRVFNLFDLDNAKSVYANSGDPLFTFDKLDAENIHPKLYYNTLDELYTNPGFFSEPRRIEFGTSLNF
jgi:outer membrane receptor for ferrienterochelin and colicin